MIDSDPVKIAVIGLGIIGPRHADAVLSNKNTQLLCLVGPNPNPKVLERFDVPWYPDVTAMLSSADIPDAAIVCTPNHTHVPISKQLLSAGIHVLCEKPISDSVESGLDLLASAKASKSSLAIGHHRRFNRYVRLTKAHLPNIGRPIAVSGLWALYKPSQYFDPPSEWRRTSSAGPILINFIHDIDILQYLLGPIIRVYAEATINQRGFDAEEGAAIILRFANGCVGTFVISDAVPSPHAFESGTGENPMIHETNQDFYRFFGTEGTLSVPDMKKWGYEEGMQKSWSSEIRADVLVGDEDSRPPFDLQIDQFARVVRGTEEPNCSGEDALRALIVCDAVKRAIRDGIPVDIPLDVV